MTHPRQWRAAALLVVSAITTLSTVFDVHWWGRPLLVLAFFLLVPGVAVVSSFGLDDALAEVTIGGAVSIGISTAVAMLMLWTHLWHPVAAELLLAVLSAPLLLAQLRHRPIWRRPLAAPSGGDRS